MNDSSLWLASSDIDPQRSLNFLTLNCRLISPVILNSCLFGQLEWEVHKTQAQAATQVEAAMMLRVRCGSMHHAGAQASKGARRLHYIVYGVFRCRLGQRRRNQEKH